MKKVCWVIPVTPGKTEIARRYCDALETTRRSDYEKSEKDIGIEVEVFFLWHGPNDRDYIVLYMSAPDLTGSLTAWVDHEGEFETLGKSQWALFSDPADWPEPLFASPGEGGLPELLSAYDVTNA